MRWLVLCFWAISATAFGQFYAGSAVFDLTPSPAQASDSCLGGYGGPFSRCGITAVTDPITVRVFALSDHDTLQVFVAIDAIGLGDELRARIKSRALELSAGQIAASSILLSATHTHSGPDLQGLWGGVSDDYEQRVIEKTVQAIVFSVLSQQPVRLSLSVAPADVVNRRGWDQVEKDGFLLVARSLLDGKPIGVLTSISAHPTILSASHQAYSSDYVHSMRLRLETAMGAPSVFVNGLVGDATPNVSARDLDAAYAFGSQAASALLRAMKTSTITLSGELHSAPFVLEHQIEPFAFLVMIYLGFLDVDIHGFNKVQLNANLIQVGESFSLLTFPGEPLTRMAMPIKDVMPGEHRFIMSVTEGAYGYFIPSDEFEKIEGRRTEENACINDQVGDDLQRALRQFVMEQN